MSRYTVTQNMGAALRNLRLKRNFKANNIAKSLNKTGAYITKLEKGELNTISSTDLITIIEVMSNNEDEIEEALHDLISDKTMQSNKVDAVSEEEWKMNLDWFYRKINIPEKYISIVKTELNNLSTLDLSNYICLNSDLYNDISFNNEKIDNLPKNQWIYYNERSFILVDISKNSIDSILNRTVLQTNYSTLFYILVSSYRLNNLTKEEAYDKARRTLHSLKIYNLKELNDTLESYDNKKRIDALLEQSIDDLPPENVTLINNLQILIKNLYTFFETYDQNYANEKLKMLNNHFDRDPILIMGYLGVDLSKLYGTNIKVKKEFVGAISELVNKYSTILPKDEKPELI